MRKFKRDRKGRFARVASSGRKKALKKNKAQYKAVKRDTKRVGAATGNRRMARKVNKGNRKNYRAQKKAIKRRTRR